jgi:hypothetical protein
LPAEAARRPGEPECVEPVWTTFPDGALTVQLSATSVKKGDEVTGQVTAHDLKLLTDPNVPNSQLGPLLLFVIIDQASSRNLRFANNALFLEHTVNLAQIQQDGSYSFHFTLKAVKAGPVALVFGWKWRILTEGACSVAIDGVYAGCKIGGQLNAACVCATLAALPAPGSWACKIHPLTFRAVWKLWGCAGPSPY